MVLGKRVAFFIANGAMIRPLEKGRKSPVVQTIQTLPILYIWACVLIMMNTVFFLFLLETVWAIFIFTVDHGISGHQ